MSDPGLYDLPSTLNENGKFPGGTKRPSASFDSTSKRFPDAGSIWPGDQADKPGPGRYDPYDGDDWMLDLRKPCYSW
eukprot:SAG31_NODE_3469_length_4238_cov_2.647741_4_plen_77_part_00